MEKKVWRVCQIGLWLQVFSPSLWYTFPGLMLDCLQLLWCFNHFTPFRWFPYRRRARWCNRLPDHGCTTFLFNRLRVPLATHKCVGPMVCLEYLGVVLDSSQMQARLPLDKVSRITGFIETLLSASSCSKCQLLQLLGHLNFASRQWHGTADSFIIDWFRWSLWH